MTKKKNKKIAPLPQLVKGFSLIDTHCHLDMNAYDDDLEDVICRANLASVNNIITVGIDLPSSQAAIELARRFPGVYATVGVHPHNVNDLVDNDYDALREMAKQDKVIAYGEIGIDCVKN